MLSRVFEYITNQVQALKINIEEPLILMVFYERFKSLSHTKYKTWTTCIASKINNQTRDIWRKYCWDTSFRVIFTTILQQLYFSSKVLSSHSIADIYTFDWIIHILNDFSPSYELNKRLLVRIRAKFWSIERTQFQSGPNVHFTH